MSYEVYEDAVHVCDLPSPANFAPGVIVNCTTTVLRSGQRGPCGERYERSGTFFTGRALWRRYDYGW